jgi:hypothetical protein
VADGHGRQLFALGAEERVVGEQQRSYFLPTKPTNAASISVSVPAFWITSCKSSRSAASWISWI